MRQYRVSAIARADLDEIWVYIGTDNPEIADRFIKRLFSKFGSLASMPGIGRARDELKFGLRSFPFGNYVIFYRASGQDIEIVRVLHGARDFPSLFQ